jgi:hypothetical protein
VMMLSGFGRLTVKLSSTFRIVGCLASAFDGTAFAFFQLASLDVEIPIAFVAGW